MENKIISRALFAVSIVLFAVTFYFFYGMFSNGAPDDFDPGQMGVELIDQGKASTGDYMEKGQEAYDKQIVKIESNIQSGVNYMKWVLYIAGGLMILFLLYGLFITATSDFKKAIPSLIFVAIAGAAFLWAFINSGSDTEGFERIVAEEGTEGAKSIISTTNFWVNGLLFVLIPGAILLAVDLIKDIVKSLAK